MVKRWGGAACALALCLLKAQAPGPAPPCTNTPAWSPCEMVLELSEQALFFSMPWIGGCPVGVGRRCLGRRLGETSLALPDIRVEFMT